MLREDFGEDSEIRVDVRGNSVRTEVGKRTKTVYNREIKGESFTIGDDGVMKIDGDFTF